MGRMKYSVWRRLRLPWRAWRVVSEVEAADEIPERLRPKDVVLVGTLRSPKWIAFDCPCRERHRVMLNLDRARRPQWRVTGTSHLTISPSVDELRGAVRCHYYVRNGRIKWVREYNDLDKRHSV
jgi:hypothetical protein